MEQMRTCSIPENDVYLDYTIYQPETESIPWAVHVEGWKNQTLDVTIHHENICHGAAYFRNLKLETPYKFMVFTATVLKTFAKLRGGIEIRGIDLRALYDGYEKGAREATQAYIFCQ